MSAWTGRQTLVTGGGGFIGGHLAVALNRAGARVRVLHRYTSRSGRGTLDWFPGADADGIEVQLGDLRDIESVAQAMSGVEVVFHLGAQIAIPYSFVNPRDYVETNVGGTLNVAQAARGAGVQRVLHVSTSEVYGNAEELPITTRHPLSPRSPYAASKASADMLMLSYHRSFDLPVAVARCFNVYGPHQSARAIVPTIAAQALTTHRIRLGLLHPRRDLTFVQDTVAGMMAIAGSPDTVGEVWQLGTGTDVSVGELVAQIGELTGAQLEVVHDTQRVRPGTSEVDRLLCDPSSTTAATGWRPATDLRTGLARTVEWVAANLPRFDTDRYTI